MKTTSTTFTPTDMLKAMAIVNIFETGRPFGEYGALAVLNDGAGISYGISQFTHRSGSLAEVVGEYLARGGSTGGCELADRLPLLRSASTASIRSAAADAVLRGALRAAARTVEMHAAQHDVAMKRYLQPALKACEGSGFSLPLSLAVIYDSMTHGSWEMVRDRVRQPATGRSISFEKAWITAYVKKRHEWLRGIPRLRATSYRTSFFLARIIAGDWRLTLPMTVHGCPLSNKNFPPEILVDTASAAGDPPSSAEASNDLPETTASERRKPFPTDTRPPLKPSAFERLEQEAAQAAAAYDRLETVVRTVLVRGDAAKSLWTTVIGTAWQTSWALASFVIGLPREVWLAVALTAAVLTTIYLYRQFALGRIRELRDLLSLERPAERHPSSARQDHERL